MSTISFTYLYLTALLIPAVVIWFWHRLVLRNAVYAWPVYKITGLVGVPVHELSHAIACLLFGLRITTMALYAPNKETGVMGYVNFQYRPNSLRHQVGCIVQGVAPLIMGGALISWLLGLSPVESLPQARADEIYIWTSQSVGLVLSSSYGIATSGHIGFLIVLLSLVISLHAIPSIADVRIGLRGFLMIAVLFLLITLSVDAAFGMDVAQLTQVRFVNAAIQTVTAALWWLIFTSITVVVLALIASILFIFIPTIAGRIVLLAF